MSNDYDGGRKPNTIRTLRQRGKLPKGEDNPAKAAREGFKNSAAVKAGKDLIKKGKRLMPKF